MSIQGYSTTSTTGNYNIDVQQNVCIFSGWTSKFDNSHNSKELNIVSWNGREPQVDIRVWYSNDADPQKHPGKGVSLNTKEANMLVDALVALGYGSGGTQATQPSQKVASKPMKSTAPMQAMPPMQPSIQQFQSMQPVQQEISSIPSVPGMPAFSPLSQNDLPF